MTSKLKFITILIMSCFYMNVGVKHFIEPEWFLQIMPPQYPSHYAAVYISGFFELLFGFMLINPKTRFIAGWGIIFLMITVFPANLISSNAIFGLIAFTAVVSAAVVYVLAQPSDLPVVKKAPQN